MVSNNSNPVQRSTYHRFTSSRWVDAPFFFVFGHSELLPAPTSLAPPSIPPLPSVPSHLFSRDSPPRERSLPSPGLHPGLLCALPSPTRPPSISSSSRHSPPPAFTPDFSPPLIAMVTVVGTSFLIVLYARILSRLLHSFHRCWRRWCRRHRLLQSTTASDLEFPLHLAAPRPSAPPPTTSAPPTASKTPRSRLSPSLYSKSKAKHLAATNRDYAVCLLEFEDDDSLCTLPSAPMPPMSTASTFGSNPMPPTPFAMLPSSATNPPLSPCELPKSAPTSMTPSSISRPRPPSQCRMSNPRSPPPPPHPWSVGMTDSISETWISF